MDSLPCFLTYSEYEGTRHTHHNRSSQTSQPLCPPQYTVTSAIRQFYPPWMTNFCIYAEPVYVVLWVVCLVPQAIKPPHL